LEKKKEVSKLLLVNGLWYEFCFLTGVDFYLAGKGQGFNFMI
jgi:hypothetical protein